MRTPLHDFQASDLTSNAPLFVRWQKPYTRAASCFLAHTRGDIHDDSDLDLLVVEDNMGNRADEMVRLRRLLRPLRIPVDVLVCSPEEADRWQDATGTVVYWAMREGEIVHG